MPGPRPKPTHLRALQGNPSKRPLPKGEPKPAGDLFAPPDDFTESQRQIWTYHLANAPAGLLKRLDRELFTAWCIACDLHRTARMMQTEIDKQASAKLLTAAAAGSPPQQSPYLPILNRQALIMAKLSAALGFSPADRTRISLGAAPDATPDNVFDDL